MANPDRKRKIAAAAAIATAIAVPAEGLRQWAYLDPPGVLTVCFGSTTNVVRGKKYSLDECKARLTADMASAINAVERCAPNLPVNVLAAFADAAYNIGPKVACDTSRSTAARLLQAGDYVGACKQLLRWNRASVAGVMVPLPGLTKRRAAEVDVCLA